MDNNNGIFENMHDYEMFIIGDIHGDFYVLKKILLETGCVIFDDTDLDKIINYNNNTVNVTDGCDFYSINKNVYWNYNKSNKIIVFVGDIIDRCRIVTNSVCSSVINDENCDYKMLKLLLDLDLEAKKCNSKIIIVLGNHEIMNLQENFKYVSTKGNNDITRKENIKKLISENASKLYGIVRINNYVICHGGINPNYITENLSFYNNDKEFIENYNIYMKNFILNTDPDENKYEKLVTSYNSPLWDRTNGLNDMQLNQEQCNEIFNNNILNIKSDILSDLKLIVAHCPQVLNKDEPTGINLVSCKNFTNKIWRVDVSMSRAFDSYIHNVPYILELLTYLDTYENSIFSFLYDEPNMMCFYTKRDCKHTAIQLLKIHSCGKEEIIHGKKTLEYFFEDVFKKNKYYKYLYVLQDMYVYYDNMYISKKYFEKVLTKINEIKLKINKKLLKTC